jgi:hypothetical protein
MLILVLRIHAIVLSSNYGLLWGSGPNGYQHGYCFNLRIENDKAKDIKIIGIQSKVRKGCSIFYEFKRLKKGLTSECVDLAPGLTGALYFEHSKCISKVLKNSYKNAYIYTSSMQSTKPKYVIFNFTHTK